MAACGYYSSLQGLKLSLFFIYLICNIYNVNSEAIRKDCPETGELFMSDKKDRCSYHQCSSGSLYGPINCAPGTAVPPDTESTNNPCIIASLKCNTLILHNPLPSNNKDSTSANNSSAATKKEDPSKSNDILAKQPALALPDSLWNKYGKPLSKKSYYKAPDAKNSPWSSPTQQQPQQSVWQQQPQPSQPWQQPPQPVPQTWSQPSPVVAPSPWQSPQPQNPPSPQSWSPPSPQTWSQPSPVQPSPPWSQPSPVQPPSPSPSPWSQPSPSPSPWSQPSPSPSPSPWSQPAPSPSPWSQPSPAPAPSPSSWSQPSPSPSPSPWSQPSPSPSPSPWSQPSPSPSPQPAPSPWSQPAPSPSPWSQPSPQPAPSPWSQPAPAPSPWSQPSPQPGPSPSSGFAQIMAVISMSHIAGGNLIWDVTSVDDCLARCSWDWSCQGFDFNVFDKTCWLHNATTECNDFMTKENVKHYRLTMCSDDTESTTEVTTTVIATNPNIVEVFIGQHIFGGRLWETMTTVDACIQACLDEDGCNGVDFDHDTNFCYGFFDNECNILVPRAHVTHYRLRDICDDDDGDNETTTTTSTTQSTSTTASTPDTTTGPEPDTIDPMVDVTEIFVNMHIFDGDLQDGIMTAADCVQACVLDSSCLGVDFNEIENLCYIHNAETECDDLEPLDDTIHYRLTTTCADTTTTSTSTTSSTTDTTTTGTTSSTDTTATTATTTTQVSTPSVLETFIGFHIFGGTEMPGVTDVAACLATCTASCAGVDFNSATQKCFLHFSTTECNTQVPKAQCVHYRIMDICSTTTASTTTSTTTSTTATTATTTTSTTATTSTASTAATTSTASTAATTAITG